MIRNLVTAALFTALAAFQFPCQATGGTLVGNPAPDFKVMSGDNKALALSDIKGKTAVLFYESKNAVEQNRKLKTALNGFYDRQPDGIKAGIARIAVIDCKGVLFGGAWKKNLRDNSAKEGMTIYGDWDGKMSADYMAKEGASNFIIIDRDGTVRYSASGRIEDGEIGAIEGLLKGLAGGN
ncbi:MAG TPA: redoxin domain-containing protein [Spirochaetota bacterium]|nr:redoxin domain-containing protein [Spirochaetota bacterium]